MRQHRRDLLKGVDLMRLPNGYGSITKLSGKRRKPWVVRITDGFDTSPDGKPIQRRKTLGYYATRTKALDALAEYNQKPYNIDLCAATFDELYNYWSADKFKRISDSAARCYKAAFAHCKPIHKVAMRDLRTKHLQDLLNNSGYATQKKIISLLNQVFKYAIANDITDKNYAEFISINAPAPEPDRMPFSEKEIALLKQIAPSEPYADTILIMIYTGWRIGELLELKRADVDLDEMTMRGGLKTEAGKNRIVPIHECIQPYVRKYYDMETKTLIPTMRYDVYREKFDSICERYGMKHRPHDCRHTFATRADNAGMNKVCIQRIMGHASQGITDKVYTHKDIDELRKAISILT